MCLESIPSQLRAILPDDPENVHVCSFNDNGPSYSATFRLKTNTTESWQQWLSSFQEKSKVTWRIKTTLPAHGRSVIFKKQYRCQHGQHRNQKQGVKFHPKNTDCRSSMMVAIRKTEFSRRRQSRSSDNHMPEWPTQVRISWDHNHVVNVPDSLKYRDVGEDTMKKIQELFEKGHSPQTALTILHSDIMQVDDSEEYITNSADRAMCPDLQFCYRLYRQIFKRHYGGDGHAMTDTIEERLLAPYNAEVGMKCAAMAKIDDHIIIAICTPMMRRVHTTRQSGEMVFFDSTGNFDRHSSQFYTLLTHSGAGGLPLGVIITSSEQQSVIEKGLQLLSGVMPTACFNSRGATGPAVFVTGDSAAERTALQNVYPKSTLLLCVYHVLIAAWKWLWDSKNGIPIVSKQTLFQNIKRIMYASIPEEAALVYLIAAEDPVTLSYSNYVEYLNGVYEKRALWGLSFRSSLIGCENYAEVAVSILKDNILHRTKTFNISQLVHFILSRLEPHYRRRLIAAVNQRPIISTRMKPTNCKKEDISQTGEMTYEVRSSDGSRTFFVDMSLGVCTCSAGISGDACNHQAAIQLHLEGVSDNALPISPEEQAIMRNIANGSQQDNPDDGVAPDVMTGESQQRDSFLEETDDQGGERSDEELSTSTQDGDTSKECAKLTIMFDALKSKLQQNPETFREPVNTMFKTFQKMTDSNMVSAMSMFGKHRASGGVERSAVARRKTASGGKRRLTSSRRTKRAADAENGHSRKRKERVPRVHASKRPRVAAPHSSSQDTSNKEEHNQSLNCVIGTLQCEANFNDTVTAKSD